MIDVARFFASPSVEEAVGRSGAPSSQPLVPFPGHGWYVCGPERSGKTTMLLQLGINVAAAGHRAVLWCDKVKLMQQPPIPEIDMASTDASTLERLEMQYFGEGGAHSLLRWLAVLHQRDRDTRPTVILVDDVGRWCSDGTQLVHVLCMLKSTVEWLRSAGAALAGYAVTDSNVYCDTRGRPRGLRRWTPLRCELQHCSAEEVPPSAGLRSAPPVAQDQPHASLMRARFRSDPGFLARVLDQSGAGACEVADVYYWLTRHRVVTAGAVLRRGPSLCPGVRERGGEADPKRRKV
eukprot:TRINITY_DN19852_c0_g1_i1.p1 TRINITY_DN19852_c0_g1~~TRINITY_DN19852_c0_g1_i1.p1  ORF type:complete len:293 (+),score=73.00 TRINITY_DN19852_c0_g1_i1:114-992(+)